MLKNPWTPIPIYEFEEEEEEVEKINDDIPENSISIKIGQLTYNSKRTFINISFQYSDTQYLNQFLYHSGNNDFNFHATLKSESSSFEDLAKRSILINLYTKSL